MVTGEDTVRVQRKHQQPFRFTPWAVPIFSANRVPTSADTSEGYLSRWEVVPFPVHLPDLPGGVNPDIERWIRTHELPGVARRWIRGLSRLMARNRFERPPAVAEAFGDFERKVDQVKEWQQERADLDRETFTRTAVLYGDYQMWAVNAGHVQPLNQGNFYGRLEQAGLRKVRRSEGWGFVGIRLRHPSPLTGMI
jgi:phage/plasmid-associated DNA primase